MIEWATYLRKFLIALAAAIAQLGYAVTPVSDRGEDVSRSEWVAVALAFFAALGVFAWKNGPQPQPGRHEAGEHSTWTADLPDETDLPNATTRFSSAGPTDTESSTGDSPGSDSISSTALGAPGEAGPTVILPPVQRNGPLV